MIDFEIPEDARLVRDKVRAFVRSECHPAEEVCTADNFETVLSELRVKARSQGLWCPFVPVEHGGMGLRPLANALVQMELGESFLGALSMNTQGPDDANHAHVARTWDRPPKRKISEARFSTAKNVSVTQ